MRLLWATWIGAAAAAEPAADEHAGTTHVVVDRDAAAVAAAGCRVEVALDGATQARCPAASLERLRGAHVRAPAVAAPKDEAVVTEGYDALFTDDWHAAGITGRGVRVAVLDVGFAGWDARGDELPADLETDFRYGDPASTSHGTAVAEVIHDLAPDAAIRLVSFRTEAEFAAALGALAADGFDVVNGSIGFDNTWAADGSSLASFAVTAAAASGVIYTAAAGNEDGRYVVGPLAASPDPLARATGRLRLNGLDAVPVYGSDGFVTVRLRWNEPFGAAATDLDLVLLDAAGKECGRSSAPQDGDDDPLEVVSTDRCGGGTTATLRLRGPDPLPEGLTGWLYAASGVPAEVRTHVDSLSLPGDAVGAFTVGAVDADDTVPEWSSRGPTDDGRLKPDAVAPTAVSTASLGAEAFDGTSASAAHAAGLAALYLSATHRYGEPDAFRAWAMAGARDLAPEGPDAGSGAGALQAGTPPDAACGCAQAPTRTSLLGLAFAAGYARRRARR